MTFVNQKAGSDKQSRTVTALLPDAVLLIRLAISVVLLILAYRINASQLISVLILICAALISGTDILVSAVRAVSEGRYFCTSCLISVAAIAAFDAGCFSESVVFIIIYQLFAALHKNLLKLTKESALRFIPEDDNDICAALRDDIKRTESCEEQTKKLERTVYTADKILCLFAVLFAVVMPLISNMTYVMSVRRGAMLLAAAAPVSLVSLFSLGRRYGLCFVSSFGVYAKNREIFDAASKVKTVVFDKTDVISGGDIKLAAVSSPMLNKESFLQIVAHSVYYSEQRVAKPLLSAYNGVITPEAIQNFSDIPGKGMELTISGKPILFGSKELFDIRGIEINEMDMRGGYVLYLAVSGKYAGSVVFSERLNPYAEQTVRNLSEMGITSILVSEDSREVCERTSGLIGISRCYSGCDTLKKMAVLKELKSGSDENDGIMFVSSENVGYHTEADIDVLVGNESDTEDITMSNIGIFGLPVLISTAGVVSTTSSQNTVFILACKLLLAVLALLGLSTLWFITLLDFAVGMLCILNILRISHSIY